MMSQGHIFISSLMYSLIHSNRARLILRQSRFYDSDSPVCVRERMFVCVRVCICVCVVYYVRDSV